LMALSITTVLSSQLSAFDLGCCNSIDWRCGWDAEFRVAAFHPTSKHYRRTYGDWAAEYQFEVSKRFNECSDFYGFISTGYLSKHGHHFSDCGCNNLSSRNSTVPLNFGIKYMNCLTSCLDYYVGVGASCRFINIKHKYRFDTYEDGDHSRINKAAWGVIAKSGLRYKVWDCAFIDLFVDYTYNHLSLNHHHSNNRGISSNVGGVLLGGGIGMTF
jgi:hypothetical protein